jgi:hypothetical protein
MLWPALRVLSQGELTPDQLRHLRGQLRLEDTPRTEGPGAARSLAHRRFVDDAGTPLVLDLARTGESGWVLALFFEGERPCVDTVEEHRVRLRDLVEHVGLTLIEIVPAATADEVHVPPPGPPGSTVGVPRGLPYDDLEQLWPHVGLRRDAPDPVKAVTLR